MTVSAVTGRGSRGTKRNARRQFGHHRTIVTLGAASAVLITGCGSTRVITRTVDATTTSLASSALVDPTTSSAAPVNPSTTSTPTSCTDYATDDTWTSVYFYSGRIAQTACQEWIRYWAAQGDLWTQYAPQSGPTAPEQICKLVYRQGQLFAIVTDEQDDDSYGRGACEALLATPGWVENVTNGA